MAANPVLTNSNFTAAMTPPANLVDQIDALALLRDGWDSYRAKAPSWVARMKAMSVVGDFVPYANAAGVRASVAPFIDGGVSVALERDDHELEIRVLNDGRLLVIADDDSMSPVDDPRALKAAIALFVQHAR